METVIMSNVYYLVLHVLACGIIGGLLIAGYPTTLESIIAMGVFLYNAIIAVVYLYLVKEDFYNES